MPISRTIREQVTGQLRDEVVGGQLAPGSVLREAELAARFGVSRGPIRDAFLQLSNEGYLAYQPNRGVTVRHPPDQADREFIAALRRQIEGHVTARGVPSIDDSSLEDIRSLLVDLQIACNRGDTAAVRRCDLAFHEAILTACGGQSLIPAWKQLCSRMAFSYERLSGYKDVYTEHEKIFRDLESRDADALREGLRANII
ncbi:GntR family transcriptional regulator [Botrimarina hoheduenensis]|uniref:Putative HTH-type transcriptional regulator YdfH n=1 Tax=Botrimarina hoheduenensis TaxID=2528000 RepID=A0A5C5VRX0_9BACT|nr:GntR family transcriptional regulator [Botrimarina hoheduenensis]TWT40675.1 putative HTH-type transcriptional regulator YdfH [Botrimarina hoheduenensis]